ncbi:MAG: ABC transporter permease, partial [Flavobacteriales bacterium]
KDEVADTTQSAAADSALAVEEPQREMTAYLIKKRNRGVFGMLSKQVEKTTMQLANVAVENSRLMNNFGLGLSVITAIAIVIMVLSFISIFISLLNSMKERKYELALMRTMGASPSKVFSLIMIEGFLLVVLGVFVGLLLSRCGLLILSTAMQSEFHYQLNQLAPTGLELLLVAGTIVIGLLASAIPAIRAMRVDISKTLSNG